MKPKPKKEQTVDDVIKIMEENANDPTKWGPAMLNEDNGVVKDDPKFLKEFDAMIDRFEESLKSEMERVKKEMGIK